MDKKHSKKNRFSEFSKFILFLFAISYFIGGVFILWVVQYQLLNTLTPEYISAEAVVTYFTAPIVSGLIGYFGKAAVENFQKISGENKIKLENATTKDVEKIAKG